MKRLSYNVDFFFFLVKCYLNISAVVNAYKEVVVVTLRNWATLHAVNYWVTIIGVKVSKNNNRNIERYQTLFRGEKVHSNETTMYKL